MAFELTIDGYTFDNPPLDYRKRVDLGNSPQPHYEKTATPFYRSDSQQITLTVSGRVNLNDQSDLDELSKLQEKGIQGGEVDVQFDPFFSGTGVIEDDPFEEENQRGRYEFSIAINEETTDSSAYPAHATPTTGNTFELGDFDFGFDPESVSQEYERQTERVDRLQGVAQTSDTKGLVTRVSLEGRVDGGGQAELWDKARANALAYLTAEFQNGWALLNTLSVSNDDATPDYIQGLFAYSAEFLIVKDPSSGIGETSQFINHDVGDSGTYTSDGDAGSGSDDGGLDFKVLGGTGSIDGRYVDWVTTTITLDDNTTNYVFVDDSDQDGVGQVTYNTTGFPSSDALPLYEVDTSNGNIVDVRDVRDSLLGEDETTTSDLLFQDEFAIDDTAFTWANILAFQDAILDPSLTESYLGKATFAETIADPTEGPILPAKGFADFSETIFLLDGGGAGGAGESEVWETTSDWDSAVSDQFTEHASDTVSMVPGIDDWEDLSDGDPPPGDWIDNDSMVVDSARSYSGSLSLHGNGNTSTRGVEASHTAVQVDETIEFYYNEASNHGGLAMGLLNESGNVIVQVASGNPQRGYTAGTSGDFGDPSPQYDVWYGWRIYNWDWSNETFDIDWFDAGGNGNSTITRTDVPFYTSSNGVGGVWYGGAELSTPGGWSADTGPDAWWDLCYGVRRESTIETATKSFSSLSQPDLASLVYSLNSQEIVLDVIGSPGTVDEEVVSVTLDGATSYSLNWTAKHTDFRVKATFRSLDRSTSPTLSSITLESGSGGGAEPDQNEQTTWEIQGAEYDRSGNEYEGGGVVSRYGG